MSDPMDILAGEEPIGDSRGEIHKCSRCKKSIIVRFGKEELNPLCDDCREQEALEEWENTHLELPETSSD